MHADEPGTSESWPMVIFNSPVVFPHVEGIAHNDTPFIEPKPDASLALAVSDSDNWIFDSIFDAPDSAVTIYNRCVLSCVSRNDADTEIFEADKETKKRQIIDGQKDHSR